MSRIRNYKFKHASKGFMNKIRSDFNYYKLTKKRSAFNDRYLLYTSNGDNNSSIN